jgi:hypothetical protein
LTIDGIPIDAAQARTYRVRDLPVPVYFDQVTLRAPESECRDSWRVPAGQPWRRARVEVEFLSTSGEELYKQLVDFGEWNGGAFMSTKGWCELTFYSEANPEHVLDPRPQVLSYKGRPQPHTSYDVVVRTIEPSSRQGDTIRLETVFRREAFGI